MEPYALPDGAKGIEGDGFAVEDRADKIVFVPKAEGSTTDYTLHGGPNSGVIDLHETGRGDGGEALEPAHQPGTGLSRSTCDGCGSAR